MSSRWEVKKRCAFHPFVWAWERKKQQEKRERLDADDRYGMIW